MRLTSGDYALPITMALPITAVESWLGQQLEERGIDAMVYSRYILNLLQQDEPEPLPLSPPAFAASNRFSLSDCAAVAGAKNKNRAKRMEKKKMIDLGLDEQRKLAAVECLKSASDEASDLESFVDELYKKLKDADTAKDLRKATSQLPKKNNADKSEGQNQDPAQRYYAAFPALSGTPDEHKPTTHLSSKVWRRLTCRSLNSDSSDSEEKLGKKESKSDGECSSTSDNSYSKTTFNKTSKVSTFTKKSIKEHLQRSTSLKRSLKAVSSKCKLPGVESPNFRLHTFKGKSIEQIKGKSLFQDVEGDIGPPAHKDNNFDALERKTSTQSDPGNNENSIVDSSFSTSQVKSSESNDKSDYCFITDHSKSDDCSERQPLYLRRRLESLTKLNEGEEIRETDEVVEKPADLMSVLWMGFDESDLQENGIDYSDEMWLGSSLIGDISFPSPAGETRPLRLYERHQKSSSDCMQVEKMDQSTFHEDELSCAAESECGQVPQAKNEKAVLASIESTIESFQDCLENNLPIVNQIKELDGNNITVEQSCALIWEEEKEASSTESDILDAKSENHVETQANQESFPAIATEVPPNTPVNLSMTSDFPGHDGYDVLGLSNLVQLAEQMKSLSQDGDLENQGVEFFSQELDGEEVYEGRICNQLGSWQSLDPMADEDPCLSPGELIGSSLLDAASEHVKSYSSMCSLFNLFDSSQDSSSDGIPTPLSFDDQASTSFFSEANFVETTGVAVVADGYEESLSGFDQSFDQILRFNDDAENDIVSREDNIKCGNKIQTENYPRFTKDTEDRNAPSKLHSSAASELDVVWLQNKKAGGDQEDSSNWEIPSGRQSPAILAVQLGHKEIMKQMGSGEMFGKEKQHNSKDLNQKKSSAINESKLKDGPISLYSGALNEIFELGGSRRAQLSPPDDIEKFTSNSCDKPIPGQEWEDAVFWDISGKSSIWADRPLDVPIAYDKMTNNIHQDVVWNDKEELWYKKENSLLEGVVLAASPDCLVPEASFVAESQHVFQTSPLRSFFSPIVQRGESRIWDVNVGRKCSIASPVIDSLSLTPWSIQQLLGRLNYASNAFHMAFIEGGLYGTEWKEVLNDDLKPASSVDESSSERTLKPPEIKHWESGSEYAASDDGCSSVSSNSCLTNTVDLLPSKTSAFSEFASVGGSSNKFNPIHHVQSDPIISPMKHCTRGLEATYRMIHIKHLYKSDTSILRQLGLASGNDDDEMSHTDVIEFSPDRHFHPIKARYTSEEHLSPTDTVSDSVTVVPEEIYTEKESLDGSWNESYSRQKARSRSSSYQLYSDMKRNAHEMLEETAYFIPSFRVDKEREKWAQTGESSPEVDTMEGSDEEADDNNGVCEWSLTQRLLTDMHKVLIDEDEDSGGAGDREDLTLKELSSSIQAASTEMQSSDYESMGQDTSGDEVSEYKPTGIEGIWDHEVLASVERATPTGTVLPKENGSALPPVKSKTWSKGQNKFQSIWSVGLDNTIALVLEVKPEPGKNLQDIGDVTVGEGAAGDEAILDACAAAISNFEDFIFEDLQGSGAVQIGAKRDQWIAEDLATRVAALVPWDEEARVLDISTDEEADLMFKLEVHGPSVPDAQRLYSSELETEWRTHNTNFSVQVPKYSKPKSKHGMRKPCSFYLEGNCHRTDCKFSHDTSLITCRFWEEGGCFKGVTCPFLHGYYRESPPKYRKRERRRHSAKSSSEFTLRNDDFPALSKLTGMDAALPVIIGEQSDEPTPARPIPAKSRKVKDRSRVKAKSLPIDIKFKTKSSNTLK